MASYIDLTTSYLDAKGIKYTRRDERSLRIAYTGDNMKSIPIIVFFDKDGGNTVQFVCWEVGNFKDKEARAYIVNNAMNAKWRWVKFYIDNDADIAVEADALVDADTCGDEIHEMVVRMVDIIDKSYPEYMRALFG